MNNQREKDLIDLVLLKQQALLLLSEFSRSRDIRTEAGLIAHAETADLLDKAICKMDELLDAEYVYTKEANKDED